MGGERKAVFIFNGYKAGKNEKSFGNQRWWQWHKNVNHKMVYLTTIKMGVVFGKAVKTLSGTHTHTPHMGMLSSILPPLST